MSLDVSMSLLCCSLQEVDPCEDLSDDDIRTAIQNATGTKNALFVPDVSEQPHDSNQAALRMS